MPPRFNIPPLTRISLVTSLGLTLVYGALKYHQLVSSDAPSSSDPAILPFITIVPGLSIIYPWVFATAALVESNIFTLAVTLSTLFYGGKYLERAWGSREFAKFLAVVAIVPNFLVFTALNVWFVLTGSGAYALSTICGGTALQIGFLVAFKQLVPEHTVTIFKGLVKIRVKHFPALLLLLTFISTLLITTLPTFLLSFTGFLTSWTYLRFYKLSYPDLPTTSLQSSPESPRLRGDASETFSLAGFFPDRIQPPIVAISNLVWNLLVALNVCTPWSDDEVAASNSRNVTRGGDVGLSSIFVSGGGGGGAPRSAGSTRAEAERRRAMALRALDQRLMAASGKATSGQATTKVHAGGSSATAGSQASGGLGETGFEDGGRS